MNLGHPAQVGGNHRPYFKGPMLLACGTSNCPMIIFGRLLDLQADRSCLGAIILLLFMCHTPLLSV